MSYALEISELTKIYANKVEALRGISMRIPKGSFYAMLGPNGAGKSTTIGIVTSLVNKTSGVVKVFGYDLDQQKEQVKNLIGVVPQEFNFSIFEKPIDIVTTQAGYYGIERKEALRRAEKYLKMLHLWDKRNVMARTLSGGMKRRLMIARALVHEPRLLILDEPTAGVDVEIRRSMWEFLSQLNQEGLTIILTTHYLEEVEQLCEWVSIIDQGRIIEDASIADLSQKISQETYIVDFALALPKNLVTNDLKISIINDKQLEVTLPKGYAVQRFFRKLDDLGLEAISVKHKVGRLEELFLELLKQEK